MAVQLFASLGVFLALLVSTHAGPRNWEACDALPTESRGRHLTPQQDPEINFVVTTSSGDPVDAYSPGEIYIVTVTPSESSKGIMLANIGSFEETATDWKTTLPEGCNNMRITWNGQAPTQSAHWTAPPAGGAPLELRTNFAAGPDAAFKQATLTLPQAIVPAEVDDLPMIDVREGELPTGTPEATPTGTPEAIPTATPDVGVTATPDAMPTGTPNGMPMTTLEPIPTEAPAPTAAPTAAPTPAPTPAPTASPTPAPPPPPTPIAEPEVTPTPTPTSAPEDDSSASQISVTLALMVCLIVAALNM